MAFHLYAFACAVSEESSEKIFPTNCTFTWLFTSVHLIVQFQTSPMRISFSTNVTFKWPFTRVYWTMLSQKRVPRKCFSTNFTFKMAFHQCAFYNALSDVCFENFFFHKHHIHMVFRHCVSGCGL